MSYILEALKKSEQERQIGHVPDLSVVQETPARAAPRWPRWLLAALLLNVAILSVLAWRVWDARMSPTVASAPTGPEPAAPAGAMPAQPATGAEPAVDTLASTSPAAVVVPEQKPAEVQDEVPEPALPEPVSQMPAPAVESVQSMQAATDPQTQLGPDLEALPPVDGADVATAVPRWEDLPAEQRAGLPVPRIDVHVFAQEPERRFVLIDLQKYKQGDTLGDGVVIETILSDGIVLSYQGQQYRVDRP